MKQKWYRHYVQVGAFLLIAAILLVQFVKPGGVIGTAKAQSAAIQRAQSATSVNATVYLATDYLASMFSSHIAASVPATFNARIMEMVSRLPKQDQGWALAMAQTLLQPSAQLLSLAPEPGGLGMSMRLSFYPGDPQPITSDMLISFQVLDSSTVQVSAQPVNGSPALISAGPLSTFSMPIGQLNSIRSTPGCGNSALALNLQFPVAIGGAQASVQGQGQAQYLTARASSAWDGARAGQDTRSPVLSQVTNAPESGPNAFIEIPASSLAQMGSSIGSLPVGNGLTAQNVRIGVSGSDLTITTDIYWNGFMLGTAVTTVAPSAENGNIVVHVVNTTFTVLWIITFPMNSYNAQIEQTLNAKLGGALAGKFNVLAAGIGPMQGLPCAAENSLVLAGAASLGV